MADVRIRALTAQAPGWAMPAAVGVAAASLVGAVARIDPATRASWSPGCPFRTLTGLDCPGCGATRAVYALTQGDLGVALDHNLFAVALLPVLAVVWVLWLLRRIRIGPSARAPVPPAAFSLGVAVAITAFWIARNLPWAPFAWLGSSPYG